MKITDNVTLGDRQVNDDGYLVANARTARIGIQQYLGSEVGRPDLALVNVYRDEAEVFSKRSLDTFSRIPVTIDHPDEAVNADNWKDYAVGTTGDDVLRDGEYLKIGLKITDAKAVKAVRDGKRELSVGYAADLVWGDGVAPDGTPYQAKQTNIIANHIAIVDRGRAGSQARIGDGAHSWGIRPFSPQTADERTSPMADTLRKVLVDGLQVETTDAGATAIEKLLKDLSSSTTKLSDLKTTHDAAITSKDSEIGELKAKLVDTEKKVPTPEAIDKLVADRSALIADAKAIHPDVKTDGISDADIRRAAVVGKFGDAVAKDASDAEILGMFKVAAADTAGDPVRKSLQNGDHRPSINDNGQNAYEKRISDAWKGA